MSPKHTSNKYDHYNYKSAGIELATSGFTGWAYYHCAGLSMSNVVLRALSILELEMEVNSINRL